MGAYLLHKNKEATTKLVIDFKGVAIGNGWMDPYVQYDVSDYMHGHGFITEGQKHELKSREKACQSLLDQKKIAGSPTCFNLLDDALASTGSGSIGKASMYDSRIFSTRNNFPPGILWIHSEKMKH